MKEIFSLLYQLAKTFLRLLPTMLRYPRETVVIWKVDREIIRLYSLPLTQGLIIGFGDTPEERGTIAGALHLMATYYVTKDKKLVYHRIQEGRREVGITDQGFLTSFANWKEYMALADRSPSFESSLVEFYGLDQDEA